ncbi:TetR/AcrR family transcriptional regulator [Streptomyces sp. NPDC056664]|uniref:TetR/AcrR family transcriptional regulator n=2 Tax=unclassified Streptomyces TaxID=2593676 RepID=UPI003694B0BB|nr:TetR/AcrR family transcriptional regulator [Streptomyces sp. CB02980]
MPDGRRDHMVTDRRTAILEAAARTIARRGVRGLRMEELAAEAGVSTALVYYHFKDRAGILRHTLEFITDRAKRHSLGQQGADGPADPGELLGMALQLEFQDLPEERENATTWGELRAGAIFEPELREALATAGAAWARHVAGLLTLARPAASAEERTASAERLTALREGLGARRLSGVLRPDHARELLGEAIEVELAHLTAHARP